MIVTPIEPIKSVEQLRDGDHFMNIICELYEYIFVFVPNYLNFIELFSERQQPVESRVIIPAFDTIKDKFKFILDYLSGILNNLFLSFNIFFLSLIEQSSCPIAEWNLNGLANGNHVLLGKVRKTIYSFLKF